tara:strand:- start:45873 stop:47978 length:2106 start_codon:yes stop_codon:yes gene_type:complete
MNSKSFAIPALLATLATAQSAPPPIPIELRARFGFTGPLVHKVGFGIHSLKIGDINGDGRLEAVVFDGRRARLVAVGVVDGETTNTTIPTGGQIASFELADFAGNGQAQALIVNSRGLMSLRNKDGSEATRPIDLGIGTRGLSLVAGDLNNDGKQDIVALAGTKMRVITNVATTPKLLPVEPTEDNLVYVNLVDLDGDHNLDMTCIASGGRMNLRMRLGNGDGTFGAWRIATVDQLRAVFGGQLADGTPVIATVEGATRRVAMHRYRDHGDLAAPQWWAFGEGDGTKTPPFAVGDVDNDGDDDVVLFPRENAQMVVYAWDNGTFVRHRVPSLSGVTSVAIGDVDQDGKNDLVMASPQEEVVAWCSGALPLDNFPEQLPAADLPVAVTVSPQGGVLALTRDKRRTAKLMLVRKGAEPQVLFDVGRLAADPVRMIAADVGDAEGMEVSFVVPSDGLRALTIAANNAKSNRKKATAGFTKKMDDGSLLLGEHEGKPALIAVRDRFVRRFRFDARNQVRVLDQNNGPDGVTELSLACELGDDQWLFFDKKSNKLVRSRPGQPVTSAEVPPLGFTNLAPHKGAALLISARGMLRVSFDTGPSLRPVATHEPPTERTYYWFGKTGDFDGDGIPDLAMIDRRLPGVQILAGGKNGLERALAIPVFETRPSESPDNEPRALATGDLDGDGLCDLVLIAHDRILIYPQDK